MSIYGQIIILLARYRVVIHICTTEVHNNKYTLKSTVQREICTKENIRGFHVLLAIRELFLTDVLVFV